jgi:hypothetical protein
MYGSLWPIYSNYLQRKDIKINLAKRYNLRFHNWPPKLLMASFKPFLPKKVNFIPTKKTGDT